MGVFIALVAVSTTILLIFSDKVIEHFFPNGSFAKISDYADDIMITK